MPTRLLRKRLRITLIGDAAKINQLPVELNNQQLQYPEYRWRAVLILDYRCSRYIDLMSEQETKTEGNPFNDTTDRGGEEASRTLPILALNEVFIGETLSSRVSYLELQVWCVTVDLWLFIFFRLTSSSPSRRGTLASV